MGFLSSIKRLLFAQKSVAKSAANKTGEYAMEKGKELSNKTMDVVGDTSDSIMKKSSGLRDAVMNKADDLLEKGKEYASDAQDIASSAFDKGKEMASDMTDKIADTEVVKKAASVSESIGDTVLDAGETVVGKAASISEDVGAVVLDKGADVMDRAKDMSEKVGHTVLDAADDVVARAKEFAGDMSDKLDATIEKAQKMEAEEALKPKKEFADDTIDADGSLLEGTDDFFSKADKFAKGEYDSFSEGKITIKDSDGVELSSSEQVSKTSLDFDQAADSNKGAKAAGFEDLDGDGNELIDDAIISDED